MEIKRIGENKIRCALTETEIQEMGFDIDEIIGNTETTQRFMKVVLRLIEEQEHISLDHVAPMVKAELLQDHSMSITFGGDSELSFKSLVDTVNQLVNKMQPNKFDEFKKLSLDEKQAAVNEMLDNFQRVEAETEQPKETKKSTVSERMTCALRFASMKDVINSSKVCFPEKVPESSLYKMDDAFYLVLDFGGFIKEEMRPFAFGAVEYDEAHYSDSAQIAYIQEHGSCIMRKDALQMLMQL